MLKKYITIDVVCRQDSLSDHDLKSPYCCLLFPADFGILWALPLPLKEGKDYPNIKS
jgi:hypothetical protein